jgi:hypothetical protein
VIRNPRAITQTRTDCDSKEAHLDSVRLTHGIRATRRNDLGNSGLRGPITSESPMRELVCCIQGLIFSRLHRRIRGARMTSSASTCGARSCSDSVDWASYERICNPDAISRRGSQAGIDGCPKIQGMTAGSFLSGKLLKPRADRWIRIRGHASALLAAYNGAPSQSLPWHGR